MNDKKTRVNKSSAIRFRSREYQLNKKTRVICYPSDHRVEQSKGLVKMIRNWLF
jgi:hypothetical protein